MNPEETVQAGMDLGAERVLSHHWATFRITNEAINEPGQRFASAAERTRISPGHFRSLLPGMAWLID
jgi:L-ascorbate metabolism protein UlaG (beta-lactamase superfamily)